MPNIKLFFSQIRQHQTYAILYCLALVFILAWGVNYGFSRFFMAIPFMVLALYIGKKLHIVIFTLVFSLGSIVCNTTLEKNSFIFPILNMWEVTFLSDGYIEVYDDGSGGFHKDNEEEAGCAGCGEIKKIPVKKWQVTKVTGISIGYPEFGRDINLITEIGPISSYDYRWLGSYRERAVSLNKEVNNKIIDNFSMLMAFPVLPFLLPFLW